MSAYTAHFRPQVWAEDETVDVDPEGEQTWDCTAAVAAHVRPDGGLGHPFRATYRGWLDNDDLLKDDPAAPAWVQQWPGPFTITVEVTPVLPEDKRQ